MMMNAAATDYAPGVEQVEPDAEEKEKRRRRALRFQKPPAP